MRKAFAVALLAPVFAVPLSHVSAGSCEDDSRELPVVEPLCWPPYSPYVGVGPRIIHVPNATDDHATVPGYDEDAPADDLSPHRHGPSRPVERRRVPRSERPVEHKHTDSKPVRSRPAENAETSGAAVQPSPPSAEQRAILGAPPVRDDSALRFDNGGVRTPQSSGR